MSRRFTEALGLAILLIGIAPNLALGQSTTAVKSQGSTADSKALAERIDTIINRRLVQENIKAGAKAEDADLCRRLHIDLTGRIPTLLHVRDFLDNDSPTKLEERVDELLAGPQFAANFAHYYRSVMLAGSNNVQAQQFQFQFEGWLRNRLSANTGFDKIAHEVIAAQTFNQGPVVNQGGFNPSAFYFVNENKAENLAGATARVFLGVRIECAQCHKHPFAKWTRQQFWEFAAFFADVQNRQPKKDAKDAVQLNIREIKIPDTDKVVQAKFATGEEPEWKEGVLSRAVLADWTVAPKNPYFARASVDHIWQYFFGVSLTEPVFEPTDDSPPAHPELLEELANAFIASGYDIKFLVRAIVLSNAYQRVSVALSPASNEEIQFFAKMPVRGMMPEQLYDSFAEATDSRQDANYEEQVNQFNRGLPDTPRQLFLGKFTSQDKRIETQTSILQALYLMNGKFLTDRVKLENNEALRTVATAPMKHARRVETLYLMVLSRLPRPEETSQLVRYIESGGGTGDTRQAVADVYWALLNSSEFMLNR
jgi:Protein of unknown function (DUF1549)/Protein of unknown function (DUF1553)